LPHHPAKDAGQFATTRGKFFGGFRGAGGFCEVRYTPPLYPYLTYHATASHVILRPNGPKNLYGPFKIPKLLHQPVKTVAVSSRKIFKMLPSFVEILHSVQDDSRVAWSIMCQKRY